MGIDIYSINPNEETKAILLQDYFRDFKTKTTLEQERFLDEEDGKTIELIGYVKDIYEDDLGNFVLILVKYGWEVEVFLNEVDKNNLGEFTKSSRVLVTGTIKADKENNSISLVNTDIEIAKLTNIKVFRASF